MFPAIAVCIVSAAIFAIRADSVSSAEPAATPPEGVKTAAGKSLSLLLKGAEGHIAQRTCFACHNQGIPILALTTASERGFPIREEELKKQLEFIAAFLERNRENYRQGKGQGGDVDTAGYALLSLELGGWKSDATTEAVVEYLLLHNKDLDHWRTTSHRPPSEASDFTANYLAIRALRTWSAAGQRKRSAQRIKAVLGWLRGAPAKDTEDRVFRLWALEAAGADEQDLRLAARELVQTQRKDGGWGQTDALDSDAYATGSALVALHRAAALRTIDPVYQRGLAFLLKNQQQDGSWLVRSRSKPFQTYYESGFPHGKDQFISVAATAWAATALALACPTSGEAHKGKKRGQDSWCDFRSPVPFFSDKLVVLTFDDSAKSHFTVVRPLLKRLGFGATFFITEGFDFRDNKRDYMTWEEIAQLHRDGFEIGNHTRDHRTVTKALLPDLAAQVRGINDRCREHGIPTPVSFAYPGNGFDVGALPILSDEGVKFARRGGSPEYAYKEGRGFAFEPGRDHPLLIPSTGDARPSWTLKDFQRAVEQARNGRIAVLQFHGVPDTAHDWVNTPRIMFEKYMNYLSEHKYKVIAMRDLAQYVDPNVVPEDPIAIIAARKAESRATIEK